jgi:uncharacterized membrane protein
MGTPPVRVYTTRMAAASGAERVVDAAVGGGVLALALAHGGRASRRAAVGALGAGIAARALFPPVPQRARACVVVAAPPDVVYRFCRDATNLRRAVGGLLDVRADDGGHIAWRTRRGTWPLLITAEQSPRLVAWCVRDRERPRGRIELRPEPGDGTVLEATIDYLARSPRRLAAALPFGSVDARLRRTLHRLKALVEDGR